MLNTTGPNSGVKIPGEILLTGAPANTLVERVRVLFRSRGYIFFDNGRDYNLNLIWVRDGWEATDRFTDRLMIIYRLHDEWHVTSLPGTTKPGLKGSLLAPVTVAGITGTAVIVEGQHRSAFALEDTCKGFSAYPFFRQIRTLPYYRDGNKDRVIDITPIQTAQFGTFMHRMSNAPVGNLNNVIVGNWSKGCIGCPLPYWDSVIRLAREALIAGFPNRFSVTILQSSTLADELLADVPGLRPGLKRSIV